MAKVRALRADARRNRDAIVEAARDVFNQDERIRFDDFAARAGVGVGTLYRHFPTREALAAAVYEGEVASLCDQAHDPAQSASENLDAFLRRFVEYVLTHRGLARNLAAVADPTVLANGGIELERTVAELLTRAAVDGAIRSDVAVGSVMVVLHGIVSAHDRPLWASESRGAVELLLAGLSRSLEPGEV
ncbi:TetR/AcrR family transcriptional regulator [soil metagenome]